MTLIAGVNDHGRRLDRILRKTLPDCPLPLIHKLLRKKLVLVNNKPATPQTRVLKGSIIKIPRLSAGKIAKKTIKIDTPARFFHTPEVLWQTDGLIAFNKSAGLAVHGPASLDRMVQAYLVDKLPPSLSFKPGPLHRLDKPSSGIVIFSTSLDGANLFSNLMKEHKIKKTYKAIVEGTVDGKHSWTDYLFRDKEKKKSFITENDKGKIAITMVVPLAAAVFMGKPYTLIEAEIETGRTHQIRAQSSFHGHPLAGDRKYSGHVFKGGFYLHAYKMEFIIDNVTHKIECPLPVEFQGVVDMVFGGITH